MRGRDLIEVEGKAVKAVARHELERLAPRNRPSSRLDDIFEVDPDLGDVSREYIGATAFRTFALLDIINDERLREWVKPSAMRPGHLDIADAVFEAAARMPLRMSEGFNVQRFVRKVGAVAQAASDAAAPQAGQGPEAST